MKELQNIIPTHEWVYTLHNNQTVYTLQNVEYVRVFWMKLWHDILSPLYSLQNVLYGIKDVDTTAPVYLSETLELVDPPEHVTSIIYFSGGILNARPLLQNPLTMNASIIVYVACVTVIIIVSIALHRNGQIVSEKNNRRIGMVPYLQYTWGII